MFFSVLPTHRSSIEMTVVFPDPEAVSRNFFLDAYE